VAVDLARATTEIAVNFSAAMERAGLGFTIDAPPLPRPVGVDREMWDRIVLNLLSNALKYTMTGEVTLRLRDAGDHVEMLVSDTGVGIAAEDLPDLFNRFHRVRGAQGRSHEGSGIGLALVSELLRLLGGSVAVESEPGVGSTFTVRLPYAREATRWGTTHDSSGPAAPFVEEALEWAAATDGAAPAGTGSLRPLLLIAEDNRDLREYLSDLLTGQYDLQLAANGADALAMARRRRPDLLLADVMMPKLDGFGLLAAIRADPVLRNLPVVLLSARAGEEAAAEGFAAGADDYLVKPFSAADLLTRLRANLDRARARSRDAAWRAAIVRALDDGVFVSEKAGVIVEVNEAFGRITGWGQRDTPYSPPYPWWPSAADDPAGRRMLEDAHAHLLREGTGTYEVPLRHREGHGRWARISATSVVDERGGDAMLVGSIRDITRERDLQAHRGAAARLAAALAAPLDAVELLAATVHGFGEVFDGDTVIATVDRSAWPPRTVITAAGPIGWESLPERVRADLQGACRRAPGSAGVQSGLLVTATPADPTRGVTHVVWTQFPARRPVTPDEHILADMLGEILSAGLDRALRESRHATAESNLRAAIDSHRFVGQAVGILMERHKLTAAAAFDGLRAASQRRNIKLRDIAEHVIATGEEPDADLRR
ncbi:MAG TPA: ATP-binding protein, partial [Pseudonocardiaceae bacterium]|nr:ATP-binding protein [Pseudonocardiaceae bacterium]